ncbi:MAG: 2-C-methyl-D-erythritol 2,4-cyclodiphosphate synthase [Candidatus Syntrophonatronum acetioxidans]|uniref:2-C-methyl-D-erythritol 2,4-cyclodiphosphate synthase n=1 Tax=Candidatus Syntrophonatronum acetioxidans TaxID=1795816 RepID=A0A424Y959_9FIRM|nr:MAG: 2-C-methyl-D-erythritol 2,4-cyclodiphosphate synthase [Candidatus Syntrophonatronum acetioxidans]
MRVGIGYDVHPFVEGRPLIMGGVEIPHSHGLAGHSDADVLIHALMDALLGAVGEGDIGSHFPDSQEEYRGISSVLLLARVMKKVRKKGFIVVNVDSVIIAQKPKLAPFIPQMISNISSVLEVEPDKVNIKATTTERLGSLGREEGIGAQAIALVSPLVE